MESHECEEKTPIHYSRPDYAGNVLVNRSRRTQGTFWQRFLSIFPREKK